MTEKSVSHNGPTEKRDGMPGGDMPRSEASAALKQGLVVGARDVSTELKHVAGDVASEAKRAAEAKLGAGKDFAAERLGAVASALRHTSEQLRSDDSGITDYVSKAASSVDQVSHYLQTRTLSQLIGDVEGFARREPAIFLGGALLAGILGGRFLKSATPRIAASASGSAQDPRTQPPPVGGIRPPYRQTWEMDGEAGALTPRQATLPGASRSDGAASQPARPSPEPQGHNGGGKGPGAQ